MINKNIFLILLIWIANVHYTVRAQRYFVHPGVTYTQGDLDRMKAMVAARQEPYYSTFLKLKESPYSSLTAVAVNRGKQIKEGRFNATMDYERCILRFLTPV